MPFRFTIQKQLELQAPNPVTKLNPDHHFGLNNQNQKAVIILSGKNTTLIAKQKPCGEIQAEEQMGCEIAVEKQ